MEIRQHPVSRWTTLLTSIALHSFTISVSQAAGINNVATAGSNHQKVSQHPVTPDSNSMVKGIDLYLETTLNGTNMGLVHFIYDDNQLWASSHVLQQLGFILPAGINPIALNGLTGVHTDYNARLQTVNIVAPIGLLDLQTTTYNTQRTTRPITTTSPGILLNYNLYGTHDSNNRTGISAYTEVRGFNASGVLSSTALTTTNNQWSGRNHWDAETVRLDTNWRKSLPDQLITIQAGDILTGALSWTRPTRLGGLQIGTNFTLQPYKTTTPLPSFFGTATLPSAVELYVNGLKQYSGDVPAGPFELNTAPSFSGAGTAQLVVTDALGQSQTLDFSLYNTPQLLQAGLVDWSAELGHVRKNYGIKSFDYGNDIAASSTLRYGMNNHFTAETHAELTDGLYNAGIGGTWLLGEAGGILFASLAGSHTSATQGNSNKADSQKGTQYSASYAWHNNRFNIGLNATGTQGTYRDIGTQYGSALAQRSERISIGMNTNNLGGFGISYNQIGYHTQDQDDAQLASAYWRKNFGRRLLLSINVTHDLQNSRNDSVLIGASMALGERGSASSSLQQQGDDTFFVADVAQAAPNDGGTGWRAQTRNSANNNDLVAELTHLSRYGQVNAGININDDSHDFYSSATGSLVMMGGGVFPSRRVNSSFAVVSTNGMADVPILLQNSPIGTTNSKGLLLVTPLNAYQENKIAINPMDLPANIKIDKVSIDATPTDQAGMVVNFDMAPVRSASLILTDPQQQLIPIGSTVEVLSQKNKGDTAVVGFDGEVYIDSLEAMNNRIKVTTPDNQVCYVTFDDATRNNGDIPLIGPLICNKVKH